MAKLKVFIVEDEPVYADQLEILVKEAGFWHIGTSDNATEAFEMITSIRPDFLLVDVNIKGSVDGIQLVDKLMKVDPDLLIIYITSYQDQRTFNRASETGPVAFLPKPIDENQILRTLELLVNKMTKQSMINEQSENSGAFSDQSVFFKSGQHLVKVRFSSILFIEVQNRDCIIYTAHNEYKIRRTLAEVEERIPDGLLSRVHRSFLVNMKCLDSYDTLRNKIIIGEHEIPVSKGYKNEVLSSLNLF